MPHEWVHYKSLRAELSFIEILHHYGVELKERGEQWQGFCPLPTHEGKRNSPSFSANIGRGIWQCFGCGAKWNVIEFATRMEGLNPENPDDFRKTALLLQKMFVGKDGEEREKRRKEVMRERSGQEDLEEERPNSVVNAPLDFELQRLDYSHPYLRERGFTEETVKTFGLGHCERGLMKGRIAIPLHAAISNAAGLCGTHQTFGPGGAVVSGNRKWVPCRARASDVDSRRTLSNGGDGQAAEDRLVRRVCWAAGGLPS